MARLPRLVLPGQAHYLIQRAHGALLGSGVFVDAIDRESFLSALRDAAAAERVQMHAYALLATEVHLLATPAEASALGRTVQGVARRYVSAYQRRHAYRGTLWDGRFRCAVLEPGDTRLAALCLIDGLSDEAGVTSASHRNGGLRLQGLVDPPEIWSLGNTPFEREAAYQALLARGLTAAQADSLRHAAMGGWAVGSAAFIAAATQATARPAGPRPRGRPARRA